MRPALDEPREKAQAVMAGVENLCRLPYLMAEHLHVLSPQLFLLSHSEIGPHHADQHIGQRDDLLPRKFAHSIKLNRFAKLAAKEHRLKPTHRRVRWDIHCVQQVCCAPSACRRRKQCARGKRCDASLE